MKCQFRVGETEKVQPALLRRGGEGRMEAESVGRGGVMFANILWVRGRKPAAQRKPLEIPEQRGTSAGTISRRSAAGEGE